MTNKRLMTSIRLSGKSNCAELKRERDEANAKIALLEAKLRERDDAISELRQGCENEQALLAEKPLNTKERESLLKLAIGLAIGGYRYDPKAKRSACVTEMRSDMESNGLSISSDTIRKFLREAADTCL
jgi:hypothetical protein